MSSTAAGSPNSSRYLDFDEYVDLKLQKTRSTIKTTDILVALAGVAAMFLGYLLVFVVLDQWVVSGGFSIGLRWLLLSTLLVMTAAWLGWKVGLPYLRTVNRLYAAREIEKADPQLKSNLLNLVDLRSSGRDVDPAILRALEKNAAVGLQNIDVAQAIDHRPLMRMAYILLAVVVMFCMYALFSPKKISNSIWRSLLPAADLSVSTRTEIVKVQPGNVSVLARESVEVSADIAGEVPEKVFVEFTTADGKFRNEPIELRTGSEGPTRFKGFLRGENGQGLLQDLTYVVRAGDAVSAEYRITVNQPPSATVDRIRFQFPAYMKLEPTEQVGGQVESWEGSKVTLTAHTNMPVKSAKLEFLDARETGPNGEEYSMSVSTDGRQLTTSWTLGFRSDGTYAKFYRIQCKTESGDTDPNPSANALTIRPDQSPEVSLLEPVRDLEVPANAVVPTLIEARDPDFELSHINLHVKKYGQPVQKEPLSEGRQQRLLLKHDLKLARFNLKPGDVVEIWVQAFDNKQPRPNSKVTPELKLKIVEPISDQEVQKKLEDDKEKRDQRLKEAEQDRNPDGAEQQPPKDPTGEEPPREARDPKQPNQEPMPRDKKPEDQPNDPKGQTGEGGKQQKSKNDSKAAGQQQQGAGEGDKSRSQPLNANGDDDEKALAELINKFKKEEDNKNKQDADQQNQPGKPKNEQKSEPNSTNSDDNPPPQPGTNSPDDKQSKTGDNASPKKGPQKSASNSSTGKDENGGKSDASKPMPKAEGSTPEGTSTDESKPPKLGNQANKTPDPKKTQSGNSSPEKGPKESTEKGTEADSAKPDTSKSDGAKPGEAGKPGDKPKPGTGDEPKPGEGDKPEASGKPDSGKPDVGKPDEAKPDGTDEGAKPKTKPEAGTDPKAGEQPGQKPGPKGGSEATAEKSEPGNVKPSQETTDKQGNGSKSDSKSPMKDGPGAEKKGPTDGPQEPAPESPNAERKDADGTEKGLAKPDRDPKSTGTPSENPDVKRDPKEKPETRPGSKPNDPNNPAKTGSDNKVKNPKPTPADAKQEKIDQPTDDQEKSPPGKNEQKRQGDPNTPNEKMKGPGQKEQRSKTGSGGEGGTGKDDKQGDPGSQNSGQGDATERPGEQQPADKKSEQGQPKPGEGKTSEEGGKKKTGDAGQDKNEQKTPSDKGGSAPSDKSKGGEQGGKPSEKGGQQGEKGGQDGGKEGGGEAKSGSEGKGGSGKGKPGAGQLGKQGNAVPAGGGQASDNNDGPGGSSPEVNDGEEANLEFKKQATELVLKRLQDGLERGDIDPELLEKLGWTEDQMRQFTERLNKHLKEAKSTDETPDSLARRQQFEEMLKNLDINKKGTTRKGDNAPQRDVIQIESHRSPVPKKYETAQDKFSKELTRQKNKPAPSQK